MEYACVRSDLACAHTLACALPAPVFPVSDGDEGLKVGSLQAILQQLLGRVHVLGDALHALVQHPRALADLALGEEKGRDRF